MTKPPRRPRGVEKITPWYVAIRKDYVFDLIYGMRRAEDTGVIKQTTSDRIMTSTLIAVSLAILATAAVVVLG